MTQNQHGARCSRASGCEPQVSLGAPSDAAYRALYERRYRPQVVRWADDRPRFPPLDAYLASGRERRSNPTCLERVICVDEAPVGTVTAFGLHRAVCELCIVLVDPERWGRGIGTAALELFFEALIQVGVRAMHLATFAENTRARAAFEKVGFRVSGRFWDHDSAREVLHMRRALDPGSARAMQQESAA